MPATNVVIHASQFPENVRRDLLVSLRTRRVNHKFHYDSHKQTQKWLALHEAHSPARTDTDCLDTYDAAFVATAQKIAAQKIHVIGLGCGGGQKDTRLLELLKKSGKQISYTPSDVSVAMTLVARKTASQIVPEKNCFPFVCDLVTADDLPKLLAARDPSLVTFFGMIPNFEPDQILPKLAALIRKKDFLLFSANLAPITNANDANVGRARHSVRAVMANQNALISTGNGAHGVTRPAVDNNADYAAGVKKILPQYDNALTHDWLLTLLLDLGIERGDGKLRFGIEDGAMKLKRVIARFQFSRRCEIVVHGEKFKFQRGESIQVFFSYRYTPDRIEKVLARHGLKVQAQWLTQSGEEGVFLCRRS